MLCVTEQCGIEKISEVCLREAIAEETERRRLHRKPFLRKAVITAIQGHPVTEPAFCRDISRDGIGLLHDCSLERGTEFSLTVPMVGRELEIQCESNWCEQVADGQFFSGNAYHCVTTPQSLVLLSAALSQALNRRLYRRYPFVRPVQLEDASGNTVVGFSRDISKSGIGLIHRAAIKPGYASVKLQTAEGEKIRGTADLRRCMSIGEGWYSSGGRFPIEAAEQ